MALGLPVERIEGIDGRRLLTGDDGSIPIPDGLSYVWINRDVASSRLIADTAASHIRPTSAGVKARVAPSPIVLRFQLDDSRFHPSSRGWLVKDAPMGKVRLGFEIWNLADRDYPLELQLSLDAAGKSTGETVRSVNVGPRSSESVEWTVDLGAFIATASHVTAHVVARDTAGLKDKLSVDLTGEADLGRR